MSNEYKTICYYSKEDNAYIMFAPDLPGCFADGETVKEAKENIAVIIEEWKDYAAELGREVPEPLTEIESTQPSVFDVAKYVLSKTGSISTMMLQKLVFYCQAWTLAWFHVPLFQNDFEAWKNGPVCRDLFYMHKRNRVVSQKNIASVHELSVSEKKMIDNVLSVYQNEDPEWLSRLTHEEQPWKATRGDLPEDAASSAVISKASIGEYYGSL